MKASSPSVTESPPPAAPEALAPGTRVLSYELQRVLARNLFGVVYLARDTIGDQTVAIKEYLPAALARRAADGLTLELRAPAHAAAFARGQRAFIDEARLFERVDHPSLLHVHRWFEAYGSAYRVMPFYPGHRLIDIRRGMDEPPDEPALRGLLDGLLGALEALHAKRAIHGDIHPGSILLQPDDTPVLLDAGAVQRAIEGDEARALIKLMGPAFAAPEQRAAAPGAATGPWTDLYALAAVVRYCIGGRLPEPGSLGMSDAKQSLAEVLREQSARHPHLRFSASFIDAIEAALAPQPQDRPQSAVQMRAALAGEVLLHGGTADELVDELNQPILHDPPIEPAPAPAPATAPPPAPEAEPRPDAAGQRTLAALQVALDTIAADIPPAAEPMYDAPTPPSQRPRGPLEPPSRRHTAWWTMGFAALLVIAAGIGFVAFQQDGNLRLGGAASAPAATASGSVAAAATPAPAPPPVEPAPADPAPLVVTPPVTTPVVVTPPVALVPTPPAPSDAASPAAPAVPKAATAAPAAAVPAKPAAARRNAAPAPAPARAASAAAARNTARTPRTTGSPREACGERTPFALYRCMQTLCGQSQWSSHAQCQRLRERDEVE